MENIKENINELLKAYKEDDEILDYINDALKSFREYVNIVVEMEHTLPIIFEKYGRIVGQQEVMRLDTSRKCAHNVAISNIKLLNKLSKKNNNTLFYEGEIDNEHRYEIGNFIGQIVFIYYHERKR